MLSKRFKYKNANIGAKYLKNLFYFLIPKLSTHSGFDCIKKTGRRISHALVPLKDGGGALDEDRGYMYIVQAAVLYSVHTSTVCKM